MRRPTLTGAVVVLLRVTCALRGHAGEHPMDREIRRSLASPWTRPRCRRCGAKLEHEPIFKSGGPVAGGAISRSSCSGRSSASSFAGPPVTKHKPAPTDWNRIGYLIGFVGVQIAAAVGTVVILRSIA